MSLELTSAAVKEYGASAGADVVGIAAAKDFGMAPDGFKPADVLPQCRSVIVLGATFPPGVLSDSAAYSASRNEMLGVMTEMAKAVAKRIKADGCKTKPISAAGGKWVQSGGRKEQFGFISLKHAAFLAGLGIIGKNYLLTNPKYGNLLWLSAVLTDATLTPDAQMRGAMCGECNLCVEACPVRALDDLSAFGKKGCSSHFKIEDKRFVIKCFACRTVCPHCFGIRGENQFQKLFFAAHQRVLFRHAIYGRTENEGTSQ